MTWQPIETAPKDDTHIFVWFDHSADPYEDPNNPNKLTPYAALAEGPYFMDGEGYCIAKWFPPHFESEDEYGNGYWLPGWWFAFQAGDYEYPCNPTHWMPLPAPPDTDKRAAALSDLAALDGETM
jgi:hypothetical protein